jgi:hypothetical protein
LDESRGLLARDRVDPDPSDPALLELSSELELEPSEGSVGGGSALANVLGVPRKALSKKFSAANLPGVFSLGRGFGMGTLPVFNIVEDFFFFLSALFTLDADSALCR